MHIDIIRRIRDETGCGLMDVKNALSWANGNEKLAKGYLHYNGCAINVKPRPGESRDDAYKRWVEEHARLWASDEINE